MEHLTHYQHLPLPHIPFIKPTKCKFETREIQALIEQIESKEMQQKLQVAMEKLIFSWSDKHDTLVDALNKLEETKTKLQHHISSLDKSMRQLSLYKSRSLHKQRKSSSSCSTTTTATTTSSSSSCSTRSSFCSTIVIPNQHPLMEHNPELDPLSFNSLNDTTSDFDLQSVLSEPEEELELEDDQDQEEEEDDDDNNHDDSDTFSNSPRNTPLASPVVSSPLTERDYKNSESILTFACGEGFWNTIARGKGDKLEVDTLISNYFRRGGNPNVAKNSETVKSVKEGYGLIHAVIAIRNTSALNRVIHAGANLEVLPLTLKSQDKLSPVLLATRIGYLNGLKLLVERGGIDLLNQRGPSGESPLHLAVQSGSEHVVIALLELQPSLMKEIDKHGATPLHYACVTGNTRILTIFIHQYQSKSDPKDFKGETPLHYAVRNRKLRAVAKLVGELGVYPNPYVLKQVPTPLDLAKSGGLKPIVEYLLKSGAKTTKEMEKRSTTTSLTVTNTIHSSNSSTFSGESSTSTESKIVVPNGVRKFLHTKTSQILRSTFDL